MLRGWKALPRPVRSGAHVALDAVLRAIAPIRRARLWRRGSAASGPVVVVGLHRAVLGIGQGARLFHRALKAVGQSVSAIDVTADFALPPVLPVSSAPVEPGGVLLTHLNPPELLHWLHRCGMRALTGRRHIGYWAWETETAPAAWAAAFAYVDEVWCPSTFTAEAIRALPGAVPVHVVPHPVFATEGLQASEGRTEGPIRVLAAFDMRSTAARKNPWAAVEAFQRADRPGAVLRVKVIAGAADPDALARLRAAEQAAGGRIELMEQDLDPAAMARLIMDADITVSLHRSEGFGLLVAESMWAGRPVLTVGWSGPADYVSHTSAALVPYALTSSGAEAGPYAGARWAEADIDTAAVRLGELIDDADERRALGLRGRAAIRAHCGPAAWRLAIQRRLAPVQTNT